MSLRRNRRSSPLPRGATAIDFAYSIHTGIGDQTVAVKINNETSPLRTELHNGDIVEIITDSASRSQPHLAVVRAYRQGPFGDPPPPAHHQPARVDFAGPATDGAGFADPQYRRRPAGAAGRTLNESSANSLDELYADIGIGKRMATLVARHIFGLIGGEAASMPVEHNSGSELDPVTICGSEGVSVQLAPCCLPIPGDQIIGQLRRDQGLLVHTSDCTQAKRQRIKEPDRWIAVRWGTELNRRFDCRIKVLINSERGILARVAAEIQGPDANIIYVGMDEDKDNVLDQLRFTVQVKDRVHLAALLRNAQGGWGQPHSARAQLNPRARTGGGSS